MIPDYDPNQYVEIARYPPYCEMHPTENKETEEKNDSEKSLDSIKDDN